MPRSPKFQWLAPDLELKPWSCDSKCRTFSRVASGRRQSKNLTEGGGRIPSSCPRITREHGDKKIVILHIIWPVYFTVLSLGGGVMMGLALNSPPPTERRRVGQLPGALLLLAKP